MAYFIQNIMDSRRTVMIPIMVSDADGQTFDYYWKLIAKPSDRVLLVHIIRPQDATKEKWHENKVQISTVIAPFEKQCVQRSMDYQIILHTGKPGEGVIDLVKEHKPDLLIVGSRGLTAFRRNFDTSVSEYVYNHAKIPVLIVGHDWEQNIAIGEEDMGAFEGDDMGSECCQVQEA